MKRLLIKTETLEANEVNDKFQLKFIEHWSPQCLSNFVMLSSKKTESIQSTQEIAFKFNITKIFNKIKLKYKKLKFHHFSSLSQSKINTKKTAFKLEY